MEFLDENQSSESFRKLGLVSLRIAISYIDGYSSLKFLEEILDIQKHNVEKFLKIPSFLNYIYGICYQSIIINLSNILVYDKDSINIFYLKSIFCDDLFQIETVKRNHELRELKQLGAFIQNVINEYPTNSAFYLGLKELRDKYIAHIDRARFNSATAPVNKLDLGDLKKAFEVIGKMVSELIETLGINPDLADFEQLNKANIQFRFLIKNFESVLLNDDHYEFQ